ncbi:MAG: DUF4870 domain-containing protein [Candidatus Hinthialibacter sp.]
MKDEIGIPPEITREERTWATFCHLASFAFFIIPPFGHIIAPLILWLLKRHDSAFIDEHGKESMNFQISVTLYGLICFLLFFFVIGLPMALILFVFWAVCAIYASIKANDGMSYRYPLTIRFL